MLGDSGPMLGRGSIKIFGTLDGGLLLEWKIVLNLRPQEGSGDKKGKK